MILRSRQALLWLALLFAHSSAFVPVSPLHNKPALALYAKGKRKKGKRAQKKQAAKQAAPAPPPAAPAPAPPPVAAPPPVTFDAAIAPEAAAPAAPPPVAAPPIAFADGAPTPAAFNAPAPPAAAFDAPPPAPAPPVTPAAAPFDEDLKSLIVDEPGKLFGQTADEQLFGSRPKGAPAPKMRAPTPKVEDDVDAKWPLPQLNLPDFGSVEKIGGERPADPTDSFDYGVGGIVKKAVYATAFAAVIWEVYINSPFFERAAPPPAVTAVQEEMSKYTPPVEGVEDPPQPPPEPIVPPPPATFE